MGSAYTAMARGVDTVQYNPAGLAGVSQTELGFSHTTWLLGSSHDFIGVAVPVGGKSPTNGRQVALGLGFTRLSNGSMEGRAADRGRTGGFEAFDQSIALGAARNFGPYALGGSVKYIQSAIAGSRASAFAVDIGARAGTLPACRSMPRWPYRTWARPCATWTSRTRCRCPPRPGC